MVPIFLGHPVYSVVIIFAAAAAAAAAVAMLVVNEALFKETVGVV